jgi:hypothetical protein
VQSFASASRVEFAHKHGLGWPEPTLYFPFANGCNKNWRSGRERKLGRLGSLEALQQAKKLGWQCSSYVALGVAQSHCLPKLQWLLNTVAWVHDEIVSNAALAANIEALRWLKAEQDVKFRDAVPFNAYKHLHVLQYFVSEGCAVDPEEACLLCSSTACRYISGTYLALAI